ncbi:hypothetical protein AJ85_06860 [Alkalihalobacillus alcalophilus ATCC 27647 = CGMCC 1.3604]|uniref:Carbohydrate diacid regulator n=1 Tax=Alkalihalobacillus alcalophilus ATCC 27647 = CGMCC 1.3604 TaxID=1218173 RepID=A0A094WSF4_ALKAL|nr:sugar diacid recognition domain-containing protein [Alkalihalobacillus alcalophilus]KGA98998.1 hypothetical protein BALCAV_0200730 [Alkalihalobacillus alcalophilus ATCC 27647 = CGMCC 1.3604]MED1560633.1 sugar diacid recognition domain-containing protein [Alkalihalobacillus alcalophilus]THG88362.1 hypothetical protein AJ85_06860 [Alkalihalobacillus alcalophilus ATCC 27647 = CGMCC 1.3604]
MRLLPELAQKVIDEVRLVMHESMIVVDEKGTIIAATESNRVGDFHQGAYHVLKSKKKLYINEQNRERFKGVKYGINLPLMFERKIIGVIGVTGHPSEIEPYADLLRKMTELMIKETYHLEQKEWQTRGLEAFFNEWVMLNEVDEAFIKRGQLLGISVGFPYLCILMEASDEDGQAVSFFMNEWFQNQFPHRSEDVLIRWQDGRFLLLRAIEGEETCRDERLEAELIRWRKAFLKNGENRRFSIGVSESVTTYSLKRAYHEASKAIKAATIEKGIIYSEELLLEIIGAEMEHSVKDEFLERVLGRLESEPELQGTLRSYLIHNQSIVDTAEALHIHKNTLHYRLKQIRELTGIDAKETLGLTLFYLAFSLRGEV